MAAWDEALGGHVAQVTHWPEEALLWPIQCRVCQAAFCDEADGHATAKVKLANNSHAGKGRASRTWRSCHDRRLQGGECGSWPSWLPSPRWRRLWQRFPLLRQASTKMCCEGLQEEERTRGSQPWARPFASSARTKRPETPRILPLHFGSTALFQAFSIFGSWILWLQLVCLFSLLGEKGAFSVDDSRAIALQLKAAVRGLHSLQILHLDLKTSNVLWCVVRRELKLADFGMSEYIPGYGPSIRFPMYVTASYRAPELWHAAQRDLSKWLGPAVDLWSFGCVLYEVAVGKILMRPLRNNLCGCENTIKEWCQQRQSLQKSLQGSIRPSLSNAQVSRNFDYRLVNRLHLLEPSFRPAIKAMLNPDPAQRDWAGIDWAKSVGFLGA